MPLPPYPAGWSVQETRQPCPSGHDEGICDSHDLEVVEQARADRIGPVAVEGREEREEAVERVRDMATGEIQIGDVQSGIDRLGIRGGGRPDRVDGLAVEAVEQGFTGAVNATGPAGMTTLGGLLELCREVTGGEAEWVPVPEEELVAVGVEPWVHLPLWLPADVARTGKKYGRQKGGGTARHGDRRAPIFIGGGKAHGPRVRDFNPSLNKKVRSLGLRMALSSHAKAGSLVIMDSLAVEGGKTKTLLGDLAKLGFGKRALVIDGDMVDTSFAFAAGNLYEVNVMPAAGANVYDILKHDTLVLTRAAVEKLEARFHG